MTTSLSSVMCQYCQTGGLRWLKVADKWRLVYPDNKLHLCRTTRDNMVRSLHHEPIGPPTYEQHLLRYLTKEGVKWMLKQKPMEIPPEDIHDPWYDFLFTDDKKRTGRERAAQQQRFEEMIP